MSEEYSDTCKGFICIYNKYWWIVSAVILYSFNINLHSISYHIWVIDVRSYNKDSNHIYLSQPSNPIQRSTLGTSYTKQITYLSMVENAVLLSGSIRMKEYILQAKYGILHANQDGWEKLTELSSLKFTIYLWPCELLFHTKCWVLHSNHFACT